MHTKRNNLVALRQEGWHRRIKPTNCSSQPNERARQCTVVDFYSTEKMKNPKLYNELAQLQKTYDARLCILNEWRKESEIRIHMHHEKPSGGREIQLNRNVDRIFHLFDGNQFTVSGGRTACTSISCVAVYNFLALKNAPLDINWKKVVKQGALIWEKQKSSNSDSTRTFYDAVEIFRMKLFDVTGMELTHEYHGYLSDTENENYKEFASLPLSESLKTMCTYATHVAAVLTIRGVSVSLYHDQKKMWLFDSHGNDVPNKSLLIEFTSVDALVTYIHQKYPVARMEYKKVDITKEIFLDFDFDTDNADAETYNQYFMATFCRMNKEQID